MEFGQFPGWQHGGAGRLTARERIKAPQFFPSPYPVCLFPLVPPQLYLL